MAKCRSDIQSTDIRERQDLWDCQAAATDVYVSVGPTLAAEKLMERHGLRIGVETLRQWMMAGELWIDRRHKLPSPHQPRRRCDYLGQLVQINGSEHRWFEDRGEMFTLLAFVDHARPTEACLAIL